MRSLLCRVLSLVLLLCLSATLFACKGSPFENGKSAYQIAVENGFVGTEQEWLESLKKANAPKIVDVIVEDGEAIVTYSDGTRQNLGALPLETEGALSFLPLPDGSFAVCAANTAIVGSVTVPATYRDLPVTRVLRRGFANCPYLFSLTLPNSITAIGEDALIGCGNLISLTLPFLGSAISDTVDAHLGFLFGADTPQQNGDCVPASLERLVLTAATALTPSALLGCRHLTEIVLPDTLTAIGANALTGCQSLTALALPFIGASPDDTENTHIGYLFGAADWAEQETAVPPMLTEITLTAETNIGHYAFYALSALRTVTLSKALCHIGEYAFAHCPLQRVYFDTDALWQTADGEPITFASPEEAAALLSGVLVGEDWLRAASEN